MQIQELKNEIIKRKEILYKKYGKNWGKALDKNNNHIPYSNIVKNNAKLFLSNKKYDSLENLFNSTIDLMLNMGHSVDEISKEIQTIYKRISKHNNAPVNIHDQVQEILSNDNKIHSDLEGSEYLKPTLKIVVSLSR